MKQSIANYETGKDPSMAGLEVFSNMLRFAGHLGSKPRGGWKIKYFKQVNFTWRVITARRDPSSTSI